MHGCNQEEANTHNQDDNTTKDVALPNDTSGSDGYTTSDTEAFEDVTNTTVRDTSNPTSSSWSCPNGMIFVPGGTFAYGPGNAATQIKPFCIDRREVTAAEFNECISAGACIGFDQWVSCEVFDETTPNACDPRRQAYPSNWMSFFDGRDYCSWLGRRLPTDKEWERSVRGDDGRPYPWGGDINCADAHYARGPAWNECSEFAGLPDGMAPAEAYADIESPYGTINQAGNAKEWVDIWNGAEPDDMPGRSRGGSWRDGPDSLLGVFGDSTLAPGIITDLHGFRCATAASAL